jgi:hypothetical protein
METFPRRLRSLLLPAHQGNEAALCLCLGTIRTGTALITFNLALSTSQTRIAFYITFGPGDE